MRYPITFFLLLPLVWGKKKHSKATDKILVRPAEEVISKDRTENQFLNRQSGVSQSAPSTPAPTEVDLEQDDIQPLQQDEEILSNSERRQFDFGAIFGHGNHGKKVKGDWMKKVRNAIVNNYTIGNRRTYGVTQGENADLYISELLYGGIHKLNITSGEAEYLVPSFDFYERPSGGIAYASPGILVVAGMGTKFGIEPILHVYDARSGDQVLSCQPPKGGQITDVTVIGNIAYATDSLVNQIIAMDLRDAIHGICNLRAIRLPVNDFYSDEGEAAVEFATGIVGFDTGLIISNHHNGGLYFLDLIDETTTKFVDSHSLSHPTGLTLADNKYLFVSESGTNQISMWKIKKKHDSIVKAYSKGVFDAMDHLEDSRTSVFLGNSLLTVNSKIHSLGFPSHGESAPASFQEEFDLVSITV